MHSPAAVCRRVFPRVPASVAATVATLVMAASLLVGSARPAAAHASLVSTVPAADASVEGVPDAVGLRFDEPVDILDDAVQVFGPDGDRVDLGTVERTDGGATLVAPIDSDAEGTFTVAWRISGEDGHTISGSFVFHNGEATGAVDVGDSVHSDGAATDAAGVAGRWLAFAGAFAVIGAALVAGLLGRRGTTRPDDPPGSDRPDEPSPVPAGASGAPAAPFAEPWAHENDTGGRGTATLAHAGAPPTTGPGAPAASAAPATAPTTAVGWLQLLAAGGAALGAVGAALALVAIVAESTGRSMPDAVSLVSDVATETRTSELALLRVVLLAAATVIALIAPLWRRSTLPVLTLAAGSLVTASLAGHAWTAPDRTIAVASDLAHLAAVAMWIGGVLALLIALPALAGDERVRVATRFSAVALGAVVVVALSGTVSGWQQLDALDDLLSTAYGQLLLLKIVGFSVLVGFGVANRARLIPLLTRAVGPLHRSLRGEAVVAALILLVTAALIHEPPTRTDEAAGDFETTVTAESGEMLAALVEPAEAGPNDIHLFFTGPGGQGTAAMDAVQVTAATEGVPPRGLQVTPITPDHVTVAGASLPSPGTWTIEVTAVQAGEPLVFTFEVPIA